MILKILSHSCFLFFIYIFYFGHIKQLAVSCSPTGTEIGSPSSGSGSLTIGLSEALENLNTPRLEENGPESLFCTKIYNYKNDQKWEKSL